MIKNLFEKYGQYKNDIFNKLSFNFEAGKNILDVGCGDGSDAEIFINEFKLKTYGIDIYEHENIQTISKLDFQKAGVFDIPFLDNSFDYVFLHDVLHHIDEEKQSYEKHIAGLRELERVAKKGGHIIIVEGNRYNPLFYPHMVKMLGHNHFKQFYFKKIMTDFFQQVSFKFFESHLYPQKYIRFWKVYERFMERFCPDEFLAYNVAIIKK